jgi:hypothetical protein
MPRLIGGLNRWTQDVTQKVFEARGQTRENISRGTLTSLPP